MSDNQIIHLKSDSDEEDIRPKKVNDQPIKTPLNVEKIEVKKNEDYPNFSQNNISITVKQPEKEEINPFEMQQSDLKNSFQDLNVSDHSDQQYKVDVSLSVHMMSEEFKSRYSPQYEQPEIKESFSKNIAQKTKASDNLLDLPLDQSVRSQKGVPPKNCFGKKKESDTPKKDSFMNNSINDIFVPTARDLNKITNMKDSISNDSNNSDEPETHSHKADRRINQIEVAKGTKQITFIFNDGTTVKKEIKEGYLEYLERYFFSYFNILLPMHEQQILQNPGVQTYLKVYFDYIVKKHPVRILQFLEASNYKEVQSSPNEKPQSGTLQDKLLEYKDMLFNSLSSGYEKVGTVVKKIKGQIPTSVRLLERLFYQQIQMSEIHQKARARIQDVIGSQNFIQMSIYENEGIENKKYILMCLRWLVGFELTIELVKEKQQKADPVENEKLEKLLTQFTLQKQKQQQQKMNTLQEKMRSIYKQ